MIRFKAFFMSSLIFFKRLYNSPTFTTWASYLARSLGFVIVLPLILKKFTAEEISLWYLFSTIISLQSLVDMGFAPTFSRSIAYAMGGAKRIGDFSNSAVIESTGEPNWEFVDRIWSTLKVIYLRLAILYTTLLAVIGTILLWRPISLLRDPSIGWFSWVIIILTSALTFWTAAYSSYLQGVNEIAKQRRPEAAFLFFSMVSSFVCLMANGNLFALVLVTQLWAIANTWWFRRLCGKVAKRRFLAFKSRGIDKDIFDSVWTSAWRSGVGIGMSYGVVQMTGVFYAQIGSAKDVASYLFSLRIAQTINYFSQAPFYTKIPILAKLRSQGRFEELVKYAQKGMFLAFMTYSVAMCIVGVIVYPLLGIIQSNIVFVSPVLWSLMAWAFFAERYGAMHLQLYSISNHIIWHWVNGISGVVNIASIIFIFGYCGVFAFPISLLLSYIIFYSWYSALRSYREFRHHFLMFEYKTSFFPFLILVNYTLWSILD